MRQASNIVDGTGVMSLRSMPGAAEADCDEDSLLLHLVHNDRTPILGMLLQNGVNAGSGDSLGRTLLHIACANGSDIMVGQLLKAGADINACVEDLNDYHGWNALMFAASNGHSACVTQLLEHGIETSHTDAFGRSALHLVCSTTSATVVDINLEVIAWKLIAAGSGVNDRDLLGYTPLIYAAESGKLRLVKILLEVRAGTGHKTVSGYTALTAARKNGHEEIAKILEPVTVSRRGQVPSLFVSCPT
ncbi:Ankyrin-2 [Pseudocercospora fuligena]|uniref:Ankyrin-2 n=1 Tax=Pseudocercospora fuligena TaxID=685502 RepID=A0A8H6R9L5_9PEZI|nr:Ankyrin-2 [Pseudocercospora fuligena]